MSRGDKRDRDRAKNQAKLAKRQGPPQRAGNPNDRNASDSIALQAKIEKKQEMLRQQQEEAAKAEASKVVKKKPKKKVDLGLDDLLNAGLKKKK